MQIILKKHYQKKIIKVVAFPLSHPKKRIRGQDLSNSAVKLVILPRDG